MEAVKKTRKDPQPGKATPAHKKYMEKTPNKTTYS